MAAYSIGLGARRAASVQQYLASIGVDVTRIGITWIGADGANSDGGQNPATMGSGDAGATR